VDAVYRHRGQLDADGYLRLMSGVGFDVAEVKSRMNDPKDPAVTRVRRDMDLADRLGVSATPTFIVLVAGQRPISATARTLPRLLNAPAVLSLLAAERRAAARQDPPRETRPGTDPASHRPPDSPPEGL
jgi:hypothetical protein